MVCNSWNRSPNICRGLLHRRVRKKGCRSNSSRSLKKTIVSSNNINIKNNINKTNKKSNKRKYRFTGWKRYYKDKSILWKRFKLCQNLREVVLDRKRVIIIVGIGVGWWEKSDGWWMMVWVLHFIWRRKR